MSYTPISAVIITFNEEINIERCLQSLVGVADEIVVVDSFSTDKTDEITQNLGAKVVRNKFDGHIEQKNFAIKQAKFPHVLSLDADEALSDELRNSILKIKANFNSDGYTFNRLTNYCGKWIKHCGWYPDVKLRLWDSRKGKWTGINPHDKFEMDDEAKITHLKGDLLHYSYYSIDGHIKQVNFFTDLLAKSMYKQGRRASWFNILLSPLVKFIKDYFIKTGFLDGYYGFVISIISAHATFLKYIKLKELDK